MGTQVDGSTFARRVAWSAASLAAALSMSCASPPPAPPLAVPTAAASTTGAPDPTVDTDCDGIADVDDACPAQAEDKDGFEDDDGCPDPDDDRDGVPDDCDACPREPGAGAHGCPARPVILRDEHIRILVAVQFPFGSVAPKPESKAVLDAVRDVMVGNPKLKKVAVTGHATRDEPRPDALSKARAQSVVKILVAAGVAADRLEARGAGISMPIVPNTTAAERERNRRVEFQLLERDEPTAPQEPVQVDPPCRPPAPTTTPAEPCHAAPRSSR
jgi:outer membrane protein OmpA-like peptidoglycan-associated protein